MNNLFENKIKEHAGEIFGNEPVSGHRERFAEKLALQKKTNRVPVRKIIIYAVSTAAILIGIVFFIQSPTTTTENGDTFTEVQNHYAILFEDKIADVKDLLEQIDSQDKIAVLKDIEKMKTETALTLQTTEEENIPFVVGLYSSKIEALEHIRCILQ